MGITHGTVGAREVSMSARIVRADGSIEELGTIAYWHRNPFKRIAWRIRRLFGRN